ncbi:hypothetical protein RJ639_041686 [Escallonia herrerae]|uniref:Uncharacterized protein n=1 Tax=Escallonia herrerae TaxID=1293975 RepID=A0AA89B1T2_9ASTE|nr:hypothetical protein RJ639_041686 [Escallonia herrerae]
MANPLIGNQGNLNLKTGLQETVEKLAKVVFRVNLLLEYHLQHGVPEIQVRVVGVLLNGKAVSADPSEALDGSKALDVRLHTNGFDDPELLGIGKELVIHLIQLQRSDSIASAIHATDLRVRSTTLHKYSL